MLSRIKVSLLRNEPVIVSKTTREAPAAGAPVLPAVFPKFSPATDNIDVPQRHQRRIVKGIANSLDFDFAVIQMVTEESHQETAVRIGAHGWFIGPVNSL